MITTLADLQAAFLVGGDVVCDPTTPIDITGGVTVGVPGTRMLGGVFTVSSGLGIEVVASNVELAGVTVTSPSTNTPDATQMLIHAHGTQAAPLARVLVHDCILNGSSADNVRMEWCIDSSVRGCVINDFLNSGVMVISGTRVAVADNVIFDGRIGTGAVEVYGVAITDLDNTEAARSSACTVTGNLIDRIDWEGIDTHGGDGIVVAGNSVTACRRAVAIVTGNTTRVTGPQRCVVLGNVIDGAGARVTPDIGIFLGGISGSPASATITGNTVAGYDDASPIVTNFWQRADTTVANNSRPHVPWTPVQLFGGYSGNVTFPPEYMVDGNTVSFRGGVIPPVGGIKNNPAIGTLPNAAAWPDARTFYATTKGSNAAAGIGVLNVDTDGSLRVEYGSTTDTFTYWLTGCYQAI